MISCRVESFDLGTEYVDTVLSKPSNLYGPEDYASCQHLSYLGSCSCGHDVTKQAAFP